MKKLLFIFCLISNIAHSVYIRGFENIPFNREELYDGLKYYPYVCQINTKKEGGYYQGSGFFVSEKKVVTAAHVICEENIEGQPKRTYKERVISKNNISIFTPTQALTLEIEDYSFYKEGQDDFVVLILKQALKGINFPGIRTLEIGQKVYKATIMGFGQGGFISSTCVRFKDVFNAYSKLYNLNTDEAILRFKKDIPGPFTVSKDTTCHLIPTMHLSTTLAKIGSGDSGSPLIDENESVIGIAVEGRSRLFNEYEENLDQIESQFKLNVFHRLLRPVIRLLNPDYSYTGIANIHSYIGYPMKSFLSLFAQFPDFYIYYHYYKKFRLKKNQSLLEEMDRDKKMFGNKYLIIDSELKNWINSLPN